MKGHKGKPKPQRGFGFPQHLRKREREKNVVDETAIQPEKRKRTTKHQCEQGASLKGHQPKQYHDPRDKKPYKQNIHISRKHRTKFHAPIKQSLRGIVTAGWRGPWAALHFWGVTPGDRSTEGYKYPPTTGTAPGGAKTNNYPNTRRLPQKIVPALSRSDMTRHNRRKHSTHQRKSKQTPNQNNVAQHHRHLCQIINLTRTLPGGNHAEVAGHLPPHEREGCPDCSKNCQIHRLLPKVQSISFP